MSITPKPTSATHTLIPQPFSTSCQTNIKAAKQMSSTT